MTKKDPSKSDDELAFLVGSRRRLEILFRTTIAEGALLQNRINMQLNAQKEGSTLEPIILNFQDDRQEDFSPPPIMQEELTKHQSEGFVFSVYRLLAWAETMRSHNLIPKESALTDLRKKWMKPVKDLRDLLMHLEDYEIKGKGKRPENYMSQGVFGGGPGSTVQLTDCSISGVGFIPFVYLIGNRLNFFELFSDLMNTYRAASETSDFGDMHKDAEHTND